VGIRSRAAHARLLLADNFLEVEACKALASALEVNSVFTELNLEWNHVYNAMKQSLCDAVAGRKGFGLRSLAQV